MIKYILSFLFSLLSVVALQAQPGKYPIKNFTSSDYKAGIQNIDFSQNRDMDIFVANNLGVLSFNGTRWDINAFRTGKKQRSVKFDEKTERLYVGSQGEFGYFENDWVYVSLLDKIPDDARSFDEVWDVFIDNGSVYFCTFQGIYVFDGDGINVIGDANGLNRSFHSGGQLFTQTSNGQIFEIVDSSLKSNYQQNVIGEIVAGIVPYQQGHLLFYNSGKIEYSTLSEVQSALPELSTELDSKYINHVMQLADSRLVISTQTAGLYLFDALNSSFENITQEDGLQSNACLRAFQDYTGNLWVGLQNGMALVDINSPLRLITERMSLLGSGYEAYDTKEGRYFSTSNGIYFLPLGSTTSVFLEGTEGPAYSMQLIESKLYAGHHTGLFLLENGRAVKKGDTDGLWKIKQLKSNPELAIAGTYSGLHLFKVGEDNILEEVGIIRGFNESSRFFEEDSQGRVWVGQFYKGLYKLELSENLQEVAVTEISKNSSLPIKQHIILTKIDGELYLGTEQGVYTINQDSDEIRKAETFNDVIGNQWVYLLEQDNQNNVHVYTEDQVGFFKQISLTNYQYVPSSLFQLRESFNNDLLHLSINVQGGVLYNANEGFIHYNPLQEDLVAINKEPIINRVYSLAEDSILYKRGPFQSRPESIEPIVIREGTKVIEIVIESFRFKSINNREFRYFLEGFDNDYGDWSNSTFKEYSNLKEGKYNLYVQTLNQLGAVVTSAPLEIVVQPPYFRSLTAKILYVVLISLLLYYGYRFQRRYYKKKHKNLEAAKKEELDQKQNELQELQEEKMKSELRHVNNLLAASTMNLVVKNEFMENIKEEIKQVRKKGQVKETQEALRKIIKDIDTTLKVQEDWKQFEYHFDKVHGDFLSRLTSQYTDLTPGEQKLCAFLRLKMDTKQIANLMSISLRGVEVARYRLRKKLDLDSQQNLSKFILEY